MLMHEDTIKRAIRLLFYLAILSAIAATIICPFVWGEHQSSRWTGVGIIAFLFTFATVGWLVMWAFDKGEC